MGIQDIAKKIAAAKAKGGGNFIKDGSGVLIVKALKYEDLYKGDTFIAEMQVESAVPMVGVVDEKGVQRPCNSPGSDVSWVQQFEENPDVAFPNTKGFILKLMGETDESMAAAAEETKKEKGLKEWTADDEFAAAFTQLCDKEQPARGMRIGFSTYRRETKKTKTEIVLVNFSTIEQDAAAIAAVRAKLDGAAPKKPEAASAA